MLRKKNTTTDKRHFSVATDQACCAPEHLRSTEPSERQQGEETEV
jgi:hypothetical protein